MLNKVNKLDVKPMPGDQFTGASKSQNADTNSDTPVSGTPGFDPGGKESAYAPGNGDVAMPVEGPRSLLHRLRMRFPGLPIIPLPDDVVSAALTANVAQDVNLPDATVAIMITSDVTIILNTASQARVPTGPADQGVYLVQPCQFIFYVGAKKQISLLATATAKVGILCFRDRPAEMDFPPDLKNAKDFGAL